MKKPQQSGRKLSLSRRTLRRLSDKQLSGIAAGNSKTDENSSLRVSDDCYSGKSLTLSC